MIRFNIAKMRILILYSMFIWVLSFLLGVISNINIDCYMDIIFLNVEVIKDERKIFYP